MSASRPMDFQVRQVRKSNLRTNGDNRFGINSPSNRNRRRQVAAQFAEPIFSVHSSFASLCSIQPFPHAKHPDHHRQHRCCLLQMQKCFTNIKYEGLFLRTIQICFLCICNGKECQMYSPTVFERNQRHVMPTLCAIVAVLSANCQCGIVGNVFNVHHILMPEYSIFFVFLPKIQ